MDVRVGVASLFICYLFPNGIQCDPRTAAVQLLRRGGGGGEEGEGEPEPAGIRDLSVDLLFGTPTHAGQCGLCGLPLRGLTRTHAQANESAR